MPKSLEGKYTAKPVSVLGQTVGPSRLCFLVGNQAYGKREAYGSISDGAEVMRVQFADARTNNEAEYMTLSVLLDNLLSNRVDPTKPQTSIYLDSKLVVGQLTEDRKVEADNLVPLHKESRIASAKNRSKAQLDSAT